MDGADKRLLLPICCISVFCLLLFLIISVLWDVIIKIYRKVWKLISDINRKYPAVTLQHFIDAMCSSRCHNNGGKCKTIALLFYEYSTSSKALLIWAEWALVINRQLKTCWFAEWSILLRHIVPGLHAVHGDRVAPTSLFSWPICYTWW